MLVISYLFLFLGGGVRGEGGGIARLQERYSTSLTKYNSLVLYIKYIYGVYSHFAGMLKIRKGVLVDKGGKVAE